MPGGFLRALWCSGSLDSARELLSFVGSFAAVRPNSLTAGFPYRGWAFEGFPYGTDLA
jgi:hypothetical protein